MSRTGPDAKAKPAPDLVGRDFRAEHPGTKLVGDITYLPTAEGWLYLACRLGRATREVVGYVMADHHRAELLVDALAMAHGAERGGVRLVVDSDRGSEDGFIRSSNRGPARSRGRIDPAVIQPRSSPAACSTATSSGETTMPTTSAYAPSSTEPTLPAPALHAGSAIDTYPDQDDVAAPCAEHLPS
ncbi:DDE-type integrase/transposase/recombinase [Streptomyces sp. NRRL WC-3549]|uniref:DDE-type integrase/transposase/recombinase n=1 Tax=Streptomyces sp. NRRL WC-3549 TaxID=1463925 RepID=UPI003B642B15